jgi:hypothetical protein
LAPSNSAPVALGKALEGFLEKALPCRAFSIAQSSTLSHVEGQQLDATFARCDGVMMDPNLCKVQRYHVMVDLAL